MQCLDGEVLAPSVFNIPIGLLLLISTEQLNKEIGATLVMRNDQNHICNSMVYRVQQLT